MGLTGGLLLLLAAAFVFPHTATAGMGISVGGGAQSALIGSAVTQSEERQAETTNDTSWESGVWNGKRAVATAFMSFFSRTHLELGGQLERDLWQGKVASGSQSLDMTEGGPYLKFGVPLGQWLPFLSVGHSFGEFTYTSQRSDSIGREQLRLETYTGICQTSRAGIGLGYQIAKYARIEFALEKGRTLFDFDPRYEIDLGDGAPYFANVPDSNVKHTITSQSLSSSLVLEF